MKYFQHVNASSFDEASALIKKSEGKTQALAGGTDLLGVCKDRILRTYPQTVVNLKTIPGFNRAEEQKDAIVVGSGSRLADLAQLPLIKEKCPALAEAARSVASPQIRHLATLGGNICQDVRCWYYRYPDSVGGAFQCKRKGGDLCYAIQGENRFHSVFGGMHTHGSACQQSCPAGTDVPGYMEQIRAGNWDAAAEIVMRANPLPMFTSRICPHPCQDTCNQRGYGESVNIHAVERSVGDYILAHQDKFYVAPQKESGKKAAVIGAGPGGLTAAYFLRRAGHAVTVFDKMEKAGGVLRYGIPHYRLPKNYVDDVVKALENMGVKFQLGVAVGKDITVEKIDAEYDSIYFGTGAWKQPVLGIAGEELTEFGLNFLQEVNTYLKKAIGNEVLVCGGGNVAMDVALTAVRLGAKKVRLVCLEKEHEMPATAEEIVRAKEEGVEILNGWGLGKVITDHNGKVRGLEAKRCLSVFDAQNRFAPVYDEKDRMAVDSDTIILATGQRVDVEFLGEKYGAQLKSARGLIDADLETGKTGKTGVYAGGDAVTGPNIAVRAIRAGRVAASNMCKDLGTAPQAKSEEKHPACFNCESIQDKESHRQEELPVSERTLTKEDTSSFTDSIAQAEAGRCMNCGCYAVSPSDIAPVLVMLDAQIVTTERTLSAKELFTTELTVQDVLKDGELVREIRIPKTAGVPHYDKFRVRDAIDFATVSLASRFIVEGGVIREARLVLGGVAPAPHALPQVEAFLKGKPVNEKTAAEAAELSLAGSAVMAKNEYKLHFIRSIVKNAILRVL